MKNTIKVLTIASVLALASSAIAEVKIGTVNMKNVFTSYYKTKDADAKMNETRGTFKRDLDEKTEKIKARYNREHPGQPFLRLRIHVLTWPRSLAGYEAGREPGTVQLVTWHAE